MDIDGWLRGIGLEQYAQTFRDNAIDADVLRDLTDSHLRELGLPLGARLKLLRAVATLGTSEQPPASPEITPPAPRTDAERRQLTVMFVDLVGSTLDLAHRHPGRAAGGLCMVPRRNIRRGADPGWRRALKRFRAK